MGIFSIAGAFLDQEPLKTDLLNFRWIFQTEFVRAGVLKTHLLPRTLCLGKINSEERVGKGGERAWRQTFEAAIPPSCNYPADHLSVRSLSVNQFRAWVTPGKINGKWAVFSLSIRRFWEKRGKMEAKKGENSPPPPSKISSPLAP